MEWVEGKRLQGGQYIIEKVLGRGGFGITYLARTSSRQLVAIKTVNKMVQDSIDFARCQKEFENEARRLQQCKHPHIVSVHDLFLEGLLWCMVMEYISGETLASYVDKQGVLSEADALHYIRQIGEALIEVHKNGLLHRDVKPRNIMLRSNSSEAVLIDFGAAREFTHNHTQTHTEVVSQGFAPYEQHFKRHKRGKYSDVYATAATLYFMVTKKVPPNALERKEGERLVPPKQLNRRISNRVNEAILQGMSLEASDRPQSMQEWLKLLEPPSEPDTRSTRIIPWKSLITVFIPYVVIGLLLAYNSAPLWVLAVSGYVAMGVAVAVAMGGAVAVAMAVAMGGAVANAVVTAVAGAVVGASRDLAEARKRLLKSFSRFHTFLILAATFELGLGVGWLGWLVYLMIFPKR